MRAAAAILLMAIATAACSGGSAATGPATAGPTTDVGAQPSTGGAQPPQGATIDACALLTEEKIEDATGSGAQAGQPSVAIGGDAMCNWALESGVLDYVEITVKESGGREQFDLYANEYYETDPEHVPGLGDDAVKTGTIPGGSVYTVVGDRLVTLRFSLPLSVDDPYALVLPLVETALSHLE